MKEGFFVLDELATAPQELSGLLYLAALNETLQFSNELLGHDASFVVYEAHSGSRTATARQLTECEVDEPNGFDVGVHSEPCSLPSMNHISVPKERQSGVLSHRYPCDERPETRNDGELASVVPRRSWSDYPA